MNDQLQAALADIIGKTGEAVSDGVGFLKAELPSVIQQLLYWKMASSFLGMVTVSYTHLTLPTILLV